MALTGTLLGSICYPTQAAAEDAYFSTQPRVYFQSATAGKIDEIMFKKDSVWRLIINDITGNTRTLETNLPTNFQAIPCDPAVQQTLNEQMFNDGLQMGWGVVTAMFAALAVIFIAKALFR